MAVRVADSLKQQNDLKTFPVAYSEDIWLDENKGEGDANFKDLQTLFNENKLGGSGLPEPESADKVLLSGSSNTRADGLEWKQVSKNDVGLQLPEFESLEEWDSLPADEKSKYYNAGKGYVVIKEDVKGAKGVIDDTKPNSTVTTLSAKKINDSLVDKAEIDDLNVSITKTFSSRMIEDHYQRSVRNEITTVQQIYDLDVTSLQVGLNTFWCSDLTIGDYSHLYGIVEAFRRGLDLNVIVHDTVRNIHFYCAKNNGTWSAWKELATMDKVTDVVKVLSTTVPNSQFSNSLDLTSRATIPSGYKFMCWVHVSSNGWVMNSPIYLANPTMQRGYAFSAEAGSLPTGNNESITFTYLVVKS